MTTPTWPDRLEIRCTAAQKKAWKIAAERNPFVQALPPNQRFSAWMRRVLDEAASDRATV